MLENFNLMKGLQPKTLTQFLYPLLLPDLLTVCSVFYFNISNICNVFDLLLAFQDEYILYGKVNEIMDIIVNLSILSSSLLTSILSNSLEPSSLAHHSSSRHDPPLSPSHSSPPPFCSLYRLSSPSISVLKQVDSKHPLLLFLQEMPLSPEFLQQFH